MAGGATYVSTHVLVDEERRCWRKNSDAHFNKRAEYDFE